MERLGRDLHLLARTGKVDVPFLDRVRQAPDPGDLHLDHVARPHRARVRRRAREDHVTGLERDQAAQVGELVGDREQKVVGRRLLHDSAVEVGPEDVVGRIELRGGHELGAERRKPS